MSGKALAIFTNKSYPGLFLPFSKWEIAEGFAFIKVANLVALNPFFSIIAFNLSFIEAVKMSDFNNCFDYKCNLILLNFKITIVHIH